MIAENITKLMEIVKIKKKKKAKIKIFVKANQSKKIDSIFKELVHSIRIQRRLTHLGDSKKTHSSKGAKIGIIQK